MKDRVESIVPYRSVNALHAEVHVGVDLYVGAGLEVVHPPEAPRLVVKDSVLDPHRDVDDAQHHPHHQDDNERVALRAVA